MEKLEDGVKSGEYSWPSILLKTLKAWQEKDWRPGELESVAGESEPRGIRCQGRAMSQYNLLKTDIQHFLCKSWLQELVGAIWLLEDFHLARTSGHLFLELEASSMPIIQPEMECEVFLYGGI